MDPIGLVGTLIAIVQISSKLVSVCYEYRTSVKGARREISHILDEIIVVRTLAEQLIDVAEQSDDVALPFLKAVNGPNAPLQRCLEELKDLKSALKLNGDLKLRSVALLWPLKQKEVEGRLAVLGRIKATLQLAVGADTAQNMVQVLANTSKIPAMQRRLSDLANTLERTVEDEKKANLIAKLPARSMASRHQEHSGERIDGTGNWIINHETYEEWKSSTSSLLWLSGGAGSGKTVLCSRIIDDLQSEYTANDDIAILYFYIDGSDRQPLSIDTLYSSFVYQLALQLRGVPRALDIHLRHWRPDDVTPKEELCRLYQTLVEDFSRIYIVVDALDECQEFIELDDMVQVLTEWLDRKMRRTNILASSRPLEQLRRPFQNLGALQISMEDDAAHVDIETAVHSQLSGGAPFRRWPQTLRNSVETTLLSRARGSFYWVICQLESLKRCMTPAAVRERLQNLPQTLESHYVRELEKLESNSGQSVRNVLRWVALSFRQLSIAELADAVAINVEDQDEPFFDVHLELFDIEAFLDSCSSLLTTYRNVDDAKHNQKVFIKFAHFSVLEFLRSAALNEDTRTKLILEDDLLHSMLAKSCLVYIHQFSASDTGDTAPLPVFMRYAASSWLKHKQLSHDKHWAVPSAQQMLQAMFDAESSSYDSWLKYSSIDKPWEYDNWTMSSWDATTQQVKIRRSQSYARPTPVYCAAFAGLTDVTTKILNSGADPNIKCGIYGYALQAAAACGHIDIVKHLMAAGADLDANGGKSGSAIAAASTAGHVAIVRILLEAGAKPQRMRYRLGDRSDDPLFMAAIGGHLDVVNLLLDYGAEDWHEMKGRPCTALSAAIQTGRLDIVRAMLRHERIRYTNQSAISGIIKTQSSGLNQGLFYAASLGHKDILRELASELTDAEMLRYAARAGDENLLSDAMARLTNFEEEGEISDHPRALQSAAIGGHLSIVKKLLASGSDPNLKSDYSTALDASVRGGNLEIARTLIEAGANVNSNRPRPLLTALSTGRRDFMELFVSHGADTYSSLLSAVKLGEFRNFNILLELGADIHRCDPDSDISLLQAAAFGGSVNIVQYLLDHGLELEDVTQTHPLTEAIRSGHVPAAKFLLDRGANVNAPPTSHQDPGSWGGTVIHGNCWPPCAAYDTPLSAAIRTKNSDLARRLLDMGALSDPQLPGTCGTPLLFAVWEEDVDIVHMLLEKGAPPNQPGSILQRKKLSYPLLLATEKGNIKILTALLAAGASVNQQDAEGFSAAHVAAGCPNASCLRTLICDHQADITLRLQNGSQPIHSAASRGDVERVQILVDAGADVNSQNDRGRTPLHWAADAENCEVVELLLDLGADVTVTADDGGVTAWDLMCLAAKKPWYSKRKERGEEEKENERAEKLRKVLSEAMMVYEMNAKVNRDDEDGLVVGHGDECTRV